jgi:hypothetical protein
MKKIFVLLFLLIATIGTAQNGISYQAVLLNPNGEQLPGADNPKIPLVNSSICLRFSIAASSGGTPEYQETITTITDPFGMVNVTIGTGNPTPGSPSFNTISWGSGPKNLKVELDLTGLCTSFITVSDQPFTSVPFALYALKSGSGGGASTTTLTGDVSGTGTGTVATTIANNAVTTTKIADSNVTNAKLQNSSITINGSIIPLGGTATIAVTADAGTLTGTTLASNVVNSSLISVGTLNNLSVTNPIAGSITGNAATVTTNANLTGDVTSSGNTTTIEANKVVTGMIADGTILVGDLADNAVETAKIKNAAVVEAKIKDAAVTYAKIQNVTATNKVLGRVSPNPGVVEEIATTGSGDVVRATSPTLVTPILGDATGTSLSVSGQLTSTVATGTAPLLITSTTPVANLSIGGNAATVTTNANLTGDVTSSGNTTTIEANKVVTGMIADGTILVGDLADNAVETAKIKNAAVVEAKIKDAAVTYAKIQNVTATNKVLGRVSPNPGVVEEIATTGSGDVVRATSPTLVTPILGDATGTSLSVSGQLTSTVATGTAPLLITSTTPVANLSIGGNAATVTTNANLTGDVTSSGNTTTIEANKVVTGMIADGTILVGDLADNAVETAKIKNAAVVEAKIKDAAVTYAKIQNVTATNKVLGRVSPNPGVVEEIATTGSGDVVRATSPTLVTPNLGVATADSVNKVAFTAPTNGATLTIADTKTLSVSDDATVSGTNTGDQTINLTGDVTGTGTGNFAATLANSGVTAGTYGTSTTVPTIVVDSKGRVISASSTSITGVSPIGSSLFNGNIIIGDGSNEAAAVAVTGDVSINNLGSTTIAPNAVTSTKIQDGTITNADISNIAAIQTTKIKGFYTGNLSVPINSSTSQITIILNSITPPIPPLYSNSTVIIQANTAGLITKGAVPVNDPSDSNLSNFELIEVNFNPISTTSTITLSYIIILN